MASASKLSKTPGSSRESSPGVFLDPRTASSGIRTPGSSRDSSPIPSEQLAAFQIEDARASPRLSRRALKELKSVEEEGAENGDDRPLYNPWTFWFERALPLAGADVTDYSQRLRNLYTVTSIKVFWCVYNNLKLASDLIPHQCYHLMRGEDRRPLWEDGENLSGGMWVFRCNKQDTNAVWREILLAAIGEQFSECTAQDDDVVGVSVKIRDRDLDVIQVWNQTASSYSHATVMQKIQELLPHIDIRVHYYSNREKMDQARYTPQHHRPPPPPRPPFPFPPPGLMDPRPSHLLRGPFPRMPPPHFHYHAPVRPPYPPSHPHHHHRPHTFTRPHPPPT